MHHNVEVDLPWYEYRYTGTPIALAVGVQTVISFKQRAIGTRHKWALMPGVTPRLGHTNARHKSTGHTNRVP